MSATVEIARVVETAYTANSASLLRHLTATTRDPSAAEELTQEAFLRLMVEINEGRVPDDIGAWIHRVGHNLAMSRGRRITVAERRNRELERPGHAPSPETAALATEQGQSLCQAVAGLAATDQCALILAANGYRGPEIARSIGRSDAATRTLLCRARTRLRARLIAAGAV